MKYIFLFLVMFNLSYGDPYFDTFVSSDDYDTYEVVNKENKNGMVITLVLSLVIVEIGLLYRKRKIKL